MVQTFVKLIIAFGLIPGIMNGRYSLKPSFKRYCNRSRHITHFIKIVRLAVIKASEIDYFLFVYTCNLVVKGSSGFYLMQLLDIVVPEHGGGQLGVEHSVVHGAPHYLVLCVN